MKNLLFTLLFTAFCISGLFSQAGDKYNAKVQYPVDYEEAQYFHKTIDILANIRTANGRMFPADSIAEILSAYYRGELGGSGNFSSQDSTRLADLWSLYLGGEFDGITAAELATALNDYYDKSQISNFLANKASYSDIQRLEASIDSLKAWRDTADLGGGSGDYSAILDSLAGFRLELNDQGTRLDSLIQNQPASPDLTPVEDTLIVHKIQIRNLKDSNNVQRTDINRNYTRLDSLINNPPGVPDLTPIEDTLALHKVQLDTLKSQIEQNDLSALTLDDILSNPFGNFAGGKKITSLGTPDDAYDAANKIYVDGQLSTKLDNGDTTAIKDTLRLHQEKIQGNKTRLDSLVDNVPPPTDLTAVEDSIERNKQQIQALQNAPSFTDFGLGGQLAPVPGNNLDTLRKSGLYYTDPGVIGRPENSNDYGSVIHLENPNLGSATQFFANDSLYFRYRIYDGWQPWVKVNSGSTGGVTAADLAAIEDSILIHRGEIDSLWTRTIPVPSISQVIGVGGIYQGAQPIELSHRNNGSSVSNSAYLELKDDYFSLGKTIYDGSVYSSQVRGDIGGLSLLGNSSEIEIMKNGIAVDVNAPQTGSAYSAMYYRYDYSNYFGDRSIPDKAYVDRGSGRKHSELTGSTYSVTSTDIGYTLYVTTANVTVTLTSLGGNVKVGDFVAFEDAGTGSITVDASAFTILDKDGNAIVTGVASLPVSAGVFKWYGNNTFKFIGQ